MPDHPFDRWTSRFARHQPNRRLVVGGLIGAALAGASRFHPVVARIVQDDCSLECTTSTCGEVPPDCPIFPADNIWNAPIDALPVDPMSDAYITSIGPDIGLHADFGVGLYEGLPLGIPFVRVPADQPAVAVTFDYADESDPGPYPIPLDAPIEGGTCGEGDRHVVVVQEGSCLLYELYAATPQADGSWQSASGAVFDLASNALRPAEWTSADAAGLPIIPGLVRYGEIEAGVIPHALRFTAATTREEYVWPARHQAGASTDPNVPPMGQRFRLNADVDIASYSSTNQVILQALKTYGMLLADNGSDWFFSGVPDDQWDNDDLHALQDGITDADFEAVDLASLIVDPDSGQAA
jgi:hypothetical protein